MFRILTNVFNGQSAHMFNMFIAKSAIFDEYTDWLMDILFEVGETNRHYRIYAI